MNPVGYGFVAVIGVSLSWDPGIRPRLLPDFKTRCRRGELAVPAGKRNVLNVLGAGLAFARDCLCCSNGTLAGA